MEAVQMKSVIFLIFLKGVRLMVLARRERQGVGLTAELRPRHRSNSSRIGVRRVTASSTSRGNAESKGGLRRGSKRKCITWRAGVGRVALGGGRAGLAVGLADERSMRTPPPAMWSKAQVGQ